jgi:uncharacterized membrane protein YkoI
VGLAALALAVAASIALGAGAVRVLTLPLAPEADPGPTGSAGIAPAATGGVAASPEAQHSEQDDQHVGNGRGGQQLSATQVVALAQHRYHARVVRTSMQHDASGRQLYVLRLLSAGGRVWTVRLDAHTGAEVQ